MRKQPNSRDCFVCGIANTGGVQVRFYDCLDDEGRPFTRARFVGRGEHQGYPGRMHGGILAGILDETIGRAINAGRSDGDPTVWGVAAKLNTRYLLPVPLDVELTATGRVTAERSRLFDGEGEILLADGSVAVRATARYVKMKLDAIAEGDPEALGWRVYEDEEIKA